MPYYFMVVSLQNINKESLVYRFITAGKPGFCSFCRRKVEKLEAHHISYSPEKTIKLCHNCHHKVHFWPNRLSDLEKLKLLRLKVGPQSAHEILKSKSFSIISFAKLIAPSRSRFVKKQQQLEIKRIKPDHRKLFKHKKSVKSKSLQPLAKSQL